MLRIPVAAVLALLVALPLAADYPELKVLSRDDPLYVQLQAGFDEFYRLSNDRFAASRQRPDPPSLAIVSYRRRPGDDLLGISARLNLLYDTLATLNGTASMAAANELVRVLVPSVPGLFVADPPSSALEDMMLTCRLEQGLAPQHVVVERAGRKEPLWFFPGESFNAVERAYFLQVLYQFPIVRGRITSRFGSRVDPITGDLAKHGGIDIGAAEGTEVRAARDGTVAEAGTSPVLGTYLVLDHAGGWQTVYGHLSSTRVTIGAVVRGGAVIGAVGRSGRATGPHLHFAVRRNESTVDPLPLLAMEKR